MAGTGAAAAAEAGTGEGRGTRTWRAGAGAWLLAATLALLATSVLGDDLTHTPPWWRVCVQTVGMLGYASIVVRLTGWSITATPQGLRVRVLRRVTLLPWEELTAAEAVRPGRLTLAGGCRGKGFVLDYAGFRRPRRLAAEIGAMIAEPARRPTR